MKVLIVGSGGREHAIAYSVAKSDKVDKIYCTPGNAGIAEFAECAPIGAMEFDKIVAFAKEKEIDLVIVGMDDPLVGGLVDELEAAGIRTFGPRKNAAILEGSKAFSKDLMKKYNIPTAAYENFTDPAKAIEYLKTEAKFPIVLKADGLALGKGVLICKDLEEAEEGVKTIMLERRFQPVTVEEPTEDECIRILEGLKEKYEAHHDVEIEEDALKAAVHMSCRYINDRFLPDKAIDVLDESCSKVKLRGFKVPENIVGTEIRCGKLEQEKEAALKAGDIEKASELHREQKEAEKKLEQAKKRFNKKNEKKKVPVTEEDVADVISMWTRIPVTRLNESESERLKKLDKTLEKRVIGQEEAIQALSKAVKRGRVGLKDPARPIGSFLFLGPTGVGKTELSKALAEALFGNEEDMIRVDMSEYMEKHSVSKMIGSPPGYVGHEDGGQLSEKVRRNPYSVILFDEIEKAHPDVFNILLQVLDDGHITDSQGRKVDFRNTVIIMTSNAGAKAIIEPKKLGFTQQEDQKADYKRMKANVMDEVKQLFRPEFLNRIDEIIVFHPLNEDNMKKIVGLMCKEVVQRAKEQLEIILVVRDSVKKHIVETGSDKKYGARPLRRAVQSQLEDKLAEALLNGEIKRGDHVEAGISKKEIKFTVREINS